MPVSFDLLADDLYLSDSETGPDVADGAAAVADAHVPQTPPFVMPDYDMPALISPLKSLPTTPKRPRLARVTETPLRARRDDIPITPGRNLFAADVAEERHLWCTLCDDRTIRYPTNRALFDHLELVHPDV